MLFFLAGFAAEQDPDSSVEFERLGGFEQELSNLLLN